MRFFYTTAFVALLLLNNSYSQHRNCGTMEVLDRQIKDQPMILKNMEEIEKQVQEYIRKNPNGNGNRAIITIPTVVHVVYNNAVPAENISDAQVLSQIAVLNQDYSAGNIELNPPDGPNTPLGIFLGLQSNAEVQFCLAAQDPNGLATTGINRKGTNVASWGTSDNVKRVANGGVDPWNPSNYLNIWVCNIGGGILGYAQFPGGAPATDGVVVDYRYFGNIGTATAPYHKGRTATHEVGHYLNLKHIWGDATCGSDLVSDTPTHNASNGGCPVYPHLSTCSGTPIEMTMNYMDYTFDACMYMFSAGQKTRMQAVLNTLGARVSLASSPGCTAPNPNACNAPAGLNTSNINTTSATSSWTAAANAVNYTYEYKLNSAGTWTTQTVSGLTVNLTGLTANTLYNTRVLTNCAAGSSVYSAIVNFTTSAPPICNDTYEANETKNTAKQFPLGTTINASIGTATDQDWFKFATTSTLKHIKVNMSNLPANYDVKLWKGTTLVGTSANLGTLNEQIIYNNAAKTTYYVQVYGVSGAFNIYNCYNLLTQISASSFRTTGEDVITEVEPIVDELLVFPNPAQDLVTLVVPFGNQTEGVLSIMDITGKVVTSQKLYGESDVKTMTMDVSQFKEGLYIANFRAGDKIYSQKLAISER